MRLSKFGAVGAALAMAATGLALPLAHSAGAALKPSVVCSKLAATTTINTTAGTGNTKSNWSLCGTSILKAGATSSVTVPVEKLTASVASTIKWKNGKGTTKVKLKYTSQSAVAPCPAGTDYRTIVTGKTLTSTGAAKNVVKPNEPINATICTTIQTPTKYTSVLLKNTKFKF